MAPRIFSFWAGVGGEAAEDRADDAGAEDHQTDPAAELARRLVILPHEDRSHPEGRGALGQAAGEIADRSQPRNACASRSAQGLGPMATLSVRLRSARARGSAAAAGSGRRRRSRPDQMGLAPWRHVRRRRRRDGSRASRTGCRRWRRPPRPRPRRRSRCSSIDRPRFSGMQTSASMETSTGKAVAAPMPEIRRAMNRP
jgi:hypothetical protein